VDETRPYRTQNGQNNYAKGKKNCRIAKLPFSSANGVAKLLPNFGKNCQTSQNLNAGLKFLNGGESILFGCSN